MYDDARHRSGEHYIQALKREVWITVVLVFRVGFINILLVISDDIGYHSKNCPFWFRDPILHCKRKEVFPLC